MYGHWLSCPQTEVQQNNAHIGTLEGHLKEAMEAKQNREIWLEEETSKALIAEVSWTQIYSAIHALHTVLSACINTSCINFEFLCVLLYTVAITENTERRIKETRTGKK